MIPFLRTLADALLKEHGTGLRDVAIVLPSQRAGLYLRKHLADAAGKALWSPELFTFPTFMERLSGLRTVDPLQALFELHDVYRAIQGDAADAFGEFLQWAPTTLRDMSEADLHLVDPEIFYRDLRALEVVEEWSLRLGDLSPGQQRLVKYWELKRDLHRGLNERLRAAGLGTTGAVERQAVQMMRSGKAGVPWSAVWIVAANAMTPAETSVTGQLRDRGLARFAWDADRYYLQDTDQEAGHYLRESMVRFGAGAIEASNDLLERERRITSVQVPNTVAQVYYAAQVIAGLDPRQRSRTAVVLADETLLMPLLRALPGEIGPVNVTMSVPIASLPVMGLFTAFFQLHASDHRDHGLHLADLSAVLLHAFLKHAGDPAFSELIDGLREGQRSFVRMEDLSDRTAAWPEKLRERVLELLKPIDDPRNEMPARVVDLIAMAREAVDDDPFASEQLYRVALVQQRMVDLLRHHADAIDTATYAQLQQRLLRSERIGFFGEPLGGLQIMGMLETRAVDHERLIVLSVVEGALPPSETGRSFIPFDVRRAFGLPLPSEAEAVTAHTFHRAIQRADEVLLVHHADDDASEPSRYIAQLERGLEGRSRTTWGTHAVGVQHTPRDHPAPAVRKSAAVISRLNERLLRGLSPTTITDHINCPLDFWYRHVLGLNADAILTERLGADRIGSAVHSVLQEIYAPFVGRPIDPRSLDLSPPELAGRLRAALQRSFLDDRIVEGQPLLQVEMAAQALSRYLAIDLVRFRQGSVVIVALEQELRVELTVEAAAGSLRVPITGKIDRIERHDGRLRIIDYKTGGARYARMNIAELDLGVIDRRHRHAVQLMIYGWLYLTQHPDVPAISARIVPLQTPSLTETSTLKLLGDGAIIRAHLPAIEKFLRAVIGDMLDPARPFSHLSESTHCAFCAS